jgi:hypothetical protein
MSDEKICGVCLEGRTCLDCKHCESELTVGDSYLSSCEIYLFCEKGYWDLSKDYTFTDRKDLRKTLYTARECKEFKPDEEEG